MYDSNENYYKRCFMDIDIKRIITGFITITAFLVFVVMSEKYFSCSVF